MNRSEALQLLGSAGVRMEAGRVEGDRLAIQPARRSQDKELMGKVYGQMNRNPNSARGSGRAATDTLMIETVKFAGVGRCHDAAPRPQRHFWGETEEALTIPRICKIA